MGRPRSQYEQPEQQQTTAEGQIAVALLSAAGVSAVAPPLLFALPPGILTAPALAAEVAEGVARFVLSAPPDIPAELPDVGILREAALNAVVYRASYALAATRRVGAAALGVEAGESRSEALRAAIAREKPYLEAHREVTRRRMSAARATEAMMELHGPVLSWVHAAVRTPAEPRPHHLAADGKNFDLRRGIPTATGALPGVKRWCSCAWGPPVRGAVMLV